VGQQIDDSRDSRITGPTVKALAKARHIVIGAEVIVAPGSIQEAELLHFSDRPRPVCDMRNLSNFGSRLGATESFNVRLQFVEKTLINAEQF
jgi:hypothetical protein